MKIFDSAARRRIAYATASFESARPRQFPEKNDFKLDNAAAAAAAFDTGLLNLNFNGGSSSGSSCRVWCLEEFKTTKNDFKLGTTKNDFKLGKPTTAWP